MSSDIFPLLSPFERNKRLPGCCSKRLGAKSTSKHPEKSVVVVAQQSEGRGLSPVTDRKIKDKAAVVVGHQYSRL